MLSNAHYVLNFIFKEDYASIAVKQEKKIVDYAKDSLKKVIFVFRADWPAIKIAVKVASFIALVLAVKCACLVNKKNSFWISKAHANTA